MGKSLQTKTKELVYDAIDDLSDEFGIDCSVYPEVYYAYKGFSFNRIGIPENEREEFEGIYYFEKNIILLSNQNPAYIYEEAGHFLHYNYSGLKYEKMGSLDVLCAQAIVEAVGFFCSKLEDSSRKPIFGNYPDFFKEREKCLKIINDTGFDKNSFFMYQQGYGIGEELFNHYISGLISKEKIRSLMSKKFERRYESTYEFIKLKRLFDKDFFFDEKIC